MTLINLYILILIAPAIIFSLRILLIEISNLLSVSDYAVKLDWLKNLLRTMTGSQVNQNEINEMKIPVLVTNCKGTSEKPVIPSKANFNILEKG